LREHGREAPGRLIAFGRRRDLLSSLEPGETVHLPSAGEEDVHQGAAGAVLVHAVLPEYWSISGFCCPLAPYRAKNDLLRALFAAPQRGCRRHALWPATLCERTVAVALPEAVGTDARR